MEDAKPLFDLLGEMIESGNGRWASTNGLGCRVAFSITSLSRTTSTPLILIQDIDSTATHDWSKPFVLTGF